MTKIKKLEGVAFCYNQTKFALHYELVHLHLRPQVQPSHHESTSGKAQFPRPTTLSQNLTAANGSLQAQVSPRPRLLLFYAPRTAGSPGAAPPRPSPAGQPPPAPPLAPDATIAPPPRAAEPVRSAPDVHRDRAHAGGQRPSGRTPASMRNRRGYWVEFRNGTSGTLGGGALHCRSYVVGSGCNCTHKNQDFAYN
jgi:hypothetical protein